MAKYNVRYEYEGQNKGMDYLEPGDVLVLQNGKQAKVFWSKRLDGELLYCTDELGIIYSRELKRIG